MREKESVRMEEVEVVYLLVEVDSFVGLGESVFE